MQINVDKTTNPLKMAEKKFTGTLQNTNIVEYSPHMILTFFVCGEEFKHTCIIQVHKSRRQQ